MSRDIRGLAERSIRIVVRIEHFEDGERVVDAHESMVSKEIRPEMLLAAVHSTGTLAVGEHLGRRGERW